MIILQNQSKILELYRILENHYGDLKWWPAETRDEILIGAILTQNTSWKNVEKSIQRLKARNLITVNSLAKSNPADVAEEIRSSGFYNQKAKRLVEVCKAILSLGGLGGLSGMETRHLESTLISINGIGMETMESILCYIFNRSVFVMDKYTFRIFERVGLFKGKDRLEIRKLVEEAIKDNRKLGNLHAALVNVGKDHCKTVPKCDGCPLSSICMYYRQIRKGVSDHSQSVSTG